MANVRRFLRSLGPITSVARAARKKLIALGVLRAPFPEIRGFHLIQGGEFVVKVADFRGSFEIDARSHFARRLLATGSFEAECAAELVRIVNPKRDAIDVGANVGFYSVLLAQHLGPDRRVLAVEPTEAASTRLRANLRRNGVADRVRVEVCAAGSCFGEAMLEIHDGLEEYSSFASVHPSVAGVAKRLQKVPVRSLDELSREAQIDPGFIKIDVEGAELSVLKGAEGLLSENRPVLMLELVPRLLAAQGTSIDDVRALMKRHGYTLRFMTEAEALALPGAGGRFRA